MAVYSTVTLRPNSTVQQGSWTVVGAANAHTALSDNVDTSYVQLTPRCRTETVRLKVGVPAPSLPAGARIFSVGVRARVQMVVTPAPQPKCLCWFECSRPQNIITTIVQFVVFLLIWLLCPRHPTTASWTTVQLEYRTSDPDGNPWTVDSFTNFRVNLGRDDINANPLRISEIYVDVNYSQQSTLSVTAPTGTVTDTSRPTVKWSYASPQSDPQEQYQVAIYTAAQVAAGGFAPFVTTPVNGTNGFILGEESQWTAGVELVNGSYSAYVQTRQAWAGLGTFEGPIASTTWTQSINGAPAAVLQSATFDSTNNRVVLVFLPSSSSPVTTSFQLQRSDDLGATWGYVRGYVQVPASGMTPITAYDYEAAFNRQARYRVLAFGTVAGVAVPSTQYSNILSVTPTAQSGSWIWLKDPFNPLLNSLLPVKYLGDTRVRKRVQGVFEPIAGSLATQKVIVSGPVYGEEGTLELIFKAKDPVDYWARFLALDESGHTLLLQWPNGDQMYVRFGPGANGSDMQWQWDIHPDLGTVRYRMVTVAYTETDKPAITS